MDNFNKKQINQKNYYQKKANVFDTKRLNANHLYKIETIGKEFFTNYSINEKVSILEVGGAQAYMPIIF